MKVGKIGEMKLIPLQEENGKIPNYLNCKWDDEGKLSFGTSSTHQHQEMVGNVSEEEGCAPCSSMPGIYLSIAFLYAII